MTYGSDFSISKAKVDLERVPVYGISIQSTVAQLVTHRRLILEAERNDVSLSPALSICFFINMLLLSPIVACFSFRTVEWCSYCIFVCFIFNQFISFLKIHVEV